MGPRGSVSQWSAIFCAPRPAKGRDARPSSYFHVCSCVIATPPHPKVPDSLTRCTGIHLRSVRQAILFSAVSRGLPPLGVSKMLQKEKGPSSVGQAQVSPRRAPELRDATRKLRAPSSQEVLAHPVPRFQADAAAAGTRATRSPMLWTPVQDSLYSRSCNLQPATGNLQPATCG